MLATLTILRASTNKGGRGSVSVSKPLGDLGLPGYVTACAVEAQKCTYCLAGDLYGKGGFQNGASACFVRPPRRAWNVTRGGWLYLCRRQSAMPAHRHKPGRGNSVANRAAHAPYNTSLVVQPTGT